MNKHNEEMKAYHRTKKGIVNKIIGSQRQRSRKRGWASPAYSTQDLRDWLFAQPLYHQLYHLWQLSGYDKMLVPSIDRIDDYEPYSFSNIQLMTWGENNSKANNDRYCGNNNKHSKTVLQYDLEMNFIQEYHSIIEAERKTGISNSSIGKCCKGKKHHAHAGGFKWEYK